ncbi:MAG: hypothetical protein KDJ65_04455 [Anaerolineae bacterium]|nr:hypothetical protein [Anaerolineae bacterium]
MRIIIEISDIELTKASATPQVITEITPQVAIEPEASVNAVPPPELLQVAARLSAESAGPAPATFTKTNETKSTSLRVFEDMDEEDIDSEDAGSAPGTMDSVN